MAKLLNILTYLGWATVTYGRVGKLKTRVGKRKNFFGALRRILPTLVWNPAGAPVFAWITSLHHLFLFSKWIYKLYYDNPVIHLKYRKQKRIHVVGLTNWSAAGVRIPVHTPAHMRTCRVAVCNGDISTCPRALPGSVSRLWRPRAPRQVVAKRQLLRAVSIHPGSRFPQHILDWTSPERTCSLLRSSIMLTLAYTEFCLRQASV